MQQTLRKMKNRRSGDDRGFTLVELLVVVVIIGVLVAIAIPMYLNYRKGAANKSASSDVRGAISAIEQFYTENANVYPVTGFNTAGKALIFGSTTTGIAGSGGTTETATASAGNTLSYKTVVATSSYYLCGQNVDGQAIYLYNSSTGGAVGKSTQATFALCVSLGT
jgi:type IV pilus assembly protein PilA